MICSVCGFEIEGKPHGPYEPSHRPRYVCDRCWNNPSLFFPDRYAMSVTQASKYSISLTPNRAIEADMMDIPLDMLKLDPKNPRFNHTLRTLTDGEMEDLIWADPNTKRLYKQIKFSQGLSEKPVVDSNYVVKEGNMRIVCLRKLREEIRGGISEIPLEKIDPVRCIVLPEDVGKVDIANYLARVHISGKSEWRPVDQAAHIHDLINRYGFTNDLIAEICGVSKVKAMRMVAAYRKTLEYHHKYPDDKEWLGRYSYFYELYKRQDSLPQGWLENEENIVLFMKWLTNGQIEKGEQVRKLPRIVSDPEAYRVLLDGGKIWDAIDVISNKDPTINSKEFKELEKTLKVIRTFPRNELIDRNGIKLKFLKKLHAELGALIEEIENKAFTLEFKPTKRGKDPESLIKVIISKIRMLKIIH